MDDLGGGGGAASAREGPIVPVLLAGGAGSRLWPLAGPLRPKPLLPLLGPHSPLSAAAGRVSDPLRFASPIVMADVEHRFAVAHELSSAGVRQCAILLEPESRDTGASAAAAAVFALAADPCAVLLIMPADHAIAEEAAFLRAVDQGREIVRRHDRILLFGIRPDRPAAGYGYIRAGRALDRTSSARRIADFTEKPDREKAQDWFAEGRHLWNSGMVLAGAARLVGEFERHAPDILRAARASLAGARRDDDFVRLDGAAFARAPRRSLDRAVLERTAHAAVLPVDFGWADLGAWSSLWDLADKDADGNVGIGAVHLHQAAGCYVRSEGPTVAVVGARDLVVVATPEATLVVARDADQAVKDVVGALSGPSCS